jgi:tetratricopeptide (TPR) repeat protein
MIRCRHQVTAAWALAGTLALCACAAVQEHEKEAAVLDDEMRAYLADKPDQARHLYATVLRQGERNAVLNHMRAGLAAFEFGADQAAARSFDLALERIEAVYANNEEAEQARSKFTKENIKDFKGDAYERAMAYYYRGLLYLRDGDYENARASFRGGMVQDSFAEDEEFAQDFALLALLDGWASHCNGDHAMAAESFAEASGYRDTLTRPGEDHNILLIAESGRAPIKLATGDYSEALEFRRGGGFIARKASFEVASRGVGGTLAEDIYWQATTRGGREIDKILAGKAQFKGTSDTVGNGLVAVGALTALSAGNTTGNSGEVALAGAAIIVAGMVAKGVAAATTPEADVRYWDNLPDRVHVATLRLDDPPSTGRVTFRDPGLRPDTDVDAAIVTAGRCSVMWARSESALDVPRLAPNSSAAATKSGEKQ